MGLNLEIFQFLCRFLIVIHLSTVTLYVQWIIFNNLMVQTSITMPTLRYLLILHRQISSHMLIQASIWTRWGMPHLLPTPTDTIHQTWMGVIIIIAMREWNCPQMNIVRAGGFLHHLSLVSFFKYIFTEDIREQSAVINLSCLCLSGDTWLYIILCFLLLGPCYADKAKASYGHGSYGGPQCEPTRLPDQGWGFHPPAMNHRNSFPVRPPPEGAVPVGSRGLHFSC